jgi:RNA-directed DNA polymerase
MVIQPIFEATFAPTSYGFRPGRGCKDALREVERLLHSGYTHIVDVDIKGYFDNIPHAPLMKLVKERIADGKVLGLIEAFLRQPVEEPEDKIASDRHVGLITPEETNEEEREKGSPQGGTISPLLANIYLNPLDWLLAELGLKSARYADDLVILATSATEAQEALERVKAWMERAQLTLHPEKTRVVDMNQSQAYFDFLGYRFWRTKKGRVARLVRPKSKKKLRESLKRPTRRTSGKCLAAIIAEINPVIRGWYAYFKQAIPGEHEKMDQWIRMRLRSILRKRNKGQGRGRGLDHFRWPNRYFEELGLVSLGRVRAKELSLLRNGAKC